MSGERVCLLSQEMAGSDVYHSAVHQLGEKCQTMTTTEAEEYCKIFDQLPYFIRPKGSVWSLESLIAFMNEEINLGTSVIGIDHQTLVSG